MVRGSQRRSTYTKLDIQETKHIDLLYCYCMSDTPRSEGISGEKYTMTPRITRYLRM